MGTVPQGKDHQKNEYKAHARAWFKTAEGGRELADKMFRLDLWSALKSELMPFCNAVKKVLDLPELPDLRL
jgi:putative ATP-dependent endonuclease of the OLD family